MASFFPTFSPYCRPRLLSQYFANIRGSFEKLKGIIAKFIKLFSRPLRILLSFFVIITYLNAFHTNYTSFKRPPSNSTIEWVAANSQSKRRRILRVRVVFAKTEFDMKLRNQNVTASVFRYTSKGYEKESAVHFCDIGVKITEKSASFV